MGEVVGQAHALVGMGQQPLHGPEHGRRHLQRRGVLVWHEPACLVDVEQRSDPPAREAVSHQEAPELVPALDDVVVHDPVPRLELVVAHVQLVQAGDGGVRRAVGVVHRRPVDGNVAVEHGQLLGDGEGLAVADHHADDLAARHP